MDSKFFDDASKEWRKNKRKCKNGYFVYTCEYVENGLKCEKDIQFRSNHSCEDHYWKLMDNI